MRGSAYACMHLRMQREQTVKFTPDDGPAMPHASTCVTWFILWHTRTHHAHIWYHLRVPRKTGTPIVYDAACNIGILVRSSITFVVRFRKHPKNKHSPYVSWMLSHTLLIRMITRRGWHFWVGFVACTDAGSIPIYVMGVSFIYNDRSHNSCKFQLAFPHALYELYYAFRNYIPMCFFIITILWNIMLYT